jgi:NAD(P)-dependent dehydrogenase (short-subunit alcohol dehydrogenase family)
MPLSDRFRTAFVSGAGSGLGEAFVQMLLDEGVKVWGTSRTPERLAKRSGFFPLQLELADVASIDLAWSKAEQASGGLDLLINNAGAAFFGSFAALPAEAWTRQLTILLDGPVRLTRLAYGAMSARGRGAIVNVTSLTIEFPMPYMTAYNAAKAALATFTESLAMEAKTAGVTLIDFRPGDYNTNFNAAARARGSTPESDDRSARAWARLEELLASAPRPARAARDLRRALSRGRPGVVRSGGFFQVVIAPLGNRLLPARIVRLLRGLYFRLG